RRRTRDRNRCHSRSRRNRRARRSSVESGITDSAIVLRDLAKSYGAVHAVRGISLDVRRAEIFGFLGLNGAGKTTTIRILFDLLRPSRGSAAVFGFDCQRESRKKIGRAHV